MNTVQNTLIKELEKQGLKLNPTENRCKISQTLHFASFTEMEIFRRSIMTLAQGACEAIESYNDIQHIRMYTNAIHNTLELASQLSFFGIADIHWMTY